MKRKRLQHVADTLCHMFCGWRLVNSYQEIEQIGSGTLRIDALTAACSHNGSPVVSLTIAGELQAWLAEDLARHGIPAEEIAVAELAAHLDLTETKGTGRVTRTYHFGRSGQYVGPDRFVRCAIRCESRIATDEKTYVSRYDDVEEWPRGWPSDEQPPD